MTASSTSGTIAWLPFLGSAFGALFALESIGVCGGTAACFSLEHSLEEEEHHSFAP